MTAFSDISKSKKVLKLNILGLGDAELCAKQHTFFSVIAILVNPCLNLNFFRELIWAKEIKNCKTIWEGMN